MFITPIEYITETESAPAPRKQQKVQTKSTAGRWYLLPPRRTSDEKKYIYDIEDQLR